MPDVTEVTEIINNNGTQMRIRSTLDLPLLLLLLLLLLLMCAAATADVRCCCC